jgi:T4 RnlA family RNA ligase
MNKQIELFDQLVKLTKETEAFYKQEFLLDDKIYWIFNYRLATYTDFMLPGALWCRGTMFEVTKDGDCVRLASLPMPKFFNINENPMTMNLDLNEIDWIEVKSDGSLMSTYMHNGELRLKSKGSLFSEQAIDAMKWLDQPENADLKKKLKSAEVHGNTVNLEWVAPWNRIVLGYLEPRLIVLNSIDVIQVDWNLKGYIDLWFSEWMNALVNMQSGLSHKEFIEQVPSMLDDIEGFIFVMKNGQRVKIKTDKYISLHHAKDSINNPRRLYECILDEGVDDLRSMFATDALAMKTIDDMQEKVSTLYNHVVYTVEKAYEDNKHLVRKDFAIKMKADINDLLFGLVMNLYIGRSNDYKDFMKRKYKEFGFNDLQKNAE